MQADEVEVRQVRARAEIGECLVEQPRVRARSGGQFVGKPGMGRVEIRAVPLHGRRSGMEGDADALAETQLAGRFELRAVHAGLQQRQSAPQGVQLREVAVRIIQVGDVT